MTLKTKPLFRTLFGTTTALLLTTSAFAQSSTTSSISGTVRDISGYGLSDAHVTILHVPTGKMYAVETDSTGHYTTTGLRPGGPYTIYVSAPDHTSISKKDIEVGVSQNLNVGFDMDKSQEEILELDAFVVVASGVTDYGTGSAGPSLVLLPSEVEMAPSVERSINDLARLNPFVVARTDYSYGDFQISAAGKNYRYNSIQIDGVQADDPFGLQANGIPSRGNLITRDAISTLSVDIANYDVRYSGYTGALINAVTKSGTNEYKGSIYGYYRSDGLVGDSDKESDEELGEFKERTYGITFGGPIIKDKLFFFLAYEEVNNETSAPNASVKLTQEQQDAILAVAEQYGIADQIGSLNPPGTNEQKDKKYLAKIDWNINNRHRASFRYQKTEGEDPIYYDYDSTYTTSYSSHWATQERTYESFVGQLYSDWTPDFSTEAAISYAAYDSTFGNLSSLPRIVIDGVGEDGNRSVELGCEEYRQANVLGTDTIDYDFHVEYRGVDKHTLSAGVKYESTDIYNLYFPYSLGQYEYDSIEDWANDNSSSYRLDYTLADQTAAADFNTGSIGVYVQDEWALKPNLKLTFGLRADAPVMGDDPAYNAQFEQDFGTSNANTPDGEFVIQPRMSLSWITMDDKLRLRAGAGLFYGKVPPVWVSNSYSNTGTAVASLRDSDPVPFSVTQTAPGSGTVPTSRINYMDEDFEMPSDWRYTLAAEYETGFWDIQAVAELIYTRVNKAISYTDENLNVAYYMADGRPIYGPSNSTQSSSRRYIHSNYYDVIRLGNTDEGQSMNVALGFRRPKGKEDGISFSAFYVYGDSEDASAGSSSQATSNFFNTAHLDANGEAVATSNYEVKDRFLLTLSKEFKWSEGYETNLSLIFDAHSGRPYSWVFNNDVNNEGSSTDNDLFYVPSGVDDPLYGGMSDPTTEAAFFAFIDSYSSLKDAKGSVVKRNSARDPFQRRLDLSITQNVKIWEDVRTQFFFNVINVANLINDEWGAVYESSFPQVRAVASATIINPYTDDAQYVYTFNEYGTKIKQRESRWQIQFGAKLSF